MQIQERTARTNKDEVFRAKTLGSTKCGINPSARARTRESKKKGGWGFEENGFILSLKIKKEVNRKGDSKVKGGSIKSSLLPLYCGAS